MFKVIILLIFVIATVFIVNCDTSSSSTEEPKTILAPTQKVTDMEATRSPASTPGPTSSPSPSPDPTVDVDGRFAVVSGIAILPDLEVDAGDLVKVSVFDLAWNEIASDNDTNPEFSFTLEGGSNYILIADYNNGQSIGAITPTIESELEQNITIDTEVAMNVVIATERAFEDLLPGSLSQPLDDLLFNANKAVSNLNSFYADRNTNRSADRVTDAIHAFTLDCLNRSMSVYVGYLNEDTIRSYGGGLSGIRDLKEMIDNPLPPLNPHFVFTRYNYRNEVDFGMSDLETKRWDYMGASGLTPHIVTGGNKVAFAKPTSTVISSIDEYLIGLYVRELGTNPNDARLLTPWNMECWTPSWSPDQSQIAFAGRYIGNPSSTRPIAWKPLNIFVIDVESGELIQMTENVGTVSERLEGSLNPAWSPDGEIIIFDHSIGGYENTRLDIVMVNDPDSRMVFLEAGADGIWQPGNPRFSPDGTQVMFSANVDDGGEVWDLEIVVLPSDYGFNGGEIRVLTANTSDDSRPDWSYDGRFIMFSSDRGQEPGKSVDGYLNPFYVLNAYTGDVVADLGDFANAGVYFGARFCGTEAVMAAVTGTQKNDTGEAIISGNDNRTSSTGNSDYNYYRETIPAANNIVDAYGSPAYNYGVTSWW